MLSGRVITGRGGNPLLWAGIFWGWWTLFGLITGLQYYHNRRVVGLAFTAWHPIVAGMLEMYVWGVFALVVFWLVRKVPLHRERWLRTAGIIAGALLVLLALKQATDLFLVNTIRFIPDRSASAFIFPRLAFQTFILFLLVGTAYGIRYFVDFRDRELAAAKLRGQLAQAQLQALKMQIHPHFLFNTLNTIAALVRENAEAAERTIEHLSDMLRASLLHVDTNEVTLREELEFVDSYLAIEQIRFGDRLAVERCIPRELLEARVPHLILQPLVENAIKHGIAPRRQPGLVRITAAAADGGLRLEIHDNGAGLGASESPGGGVGISNVRARLYQLYGPDGRLTLKNGGDSGAVAEVELPLKRS